MSIHKQVTLSATPSDVYEVLVDADRLSSLSAMSGVAGVALGDEFSAFDGHVVGRQIEFVEGERIVQTWRFPLWDDGVHSLVRFSLTEVDGRTLLEIEQHGEPAEWHDHIETNWPTFYLTPLANHFVAQPAG
jgi:activator of HSP90 ATPase